MNLIFCPSADSLEVFTRMISSTSIVFQYLIYWVIYMGWSLTLSGIFEVFFKETLHDSAYARSTPVFTFIIGLLSAAWFSKYRYGYTSLPSRYQEILVAITNFSSTYFTSIEMHLRRFTPSANLKGAKDGEVVDAMMIARDACLAYSAYSYQLFSASETDDLVNLDQSVEELVISRANGSPFQLLQRLNMVLSAQAERLQEAGVISNVQLTRLTAQLSEIARLCNDIERMSHIVEPPLFDKLMVGLMFIYLMLWMPFQQWSVYGLTALAIFYPVEMLLLTSLMIGRGFIREAFDPARPVSYMNFGEWRSLAYGRTMDYYRAALDVLSDDARAKSAERIDNSRLHVMRHPQKLFGSTGSKTRDRQLQTPVTIYMKDLSEASHGLRRNWTRSNWPLPAGSEPNPNLGGSNSEGTVFPMFSTISIGVSTASMQQGADAVNPYSTYSEEQSK